MSINTQSVEFKFGRLLGRLENNLENNNDLDFETFIEKVNDYKNDLELDNDMLFDICNLFYGEITIVNYKNRKVVVGLVYDVRDVVYYCKTDKKVKHLDYDDDEIMELINDMD